MTHGGPGDCFFFTRWRQCVWPAVLSCSHCVCLCCLSLGVQHVDSLLIYERQSLLDLRLTVKFDYGGQNTLPPFLSDLLDRVPSGVTSLYFSPIAGHCRRLFISVVGLDEEFQSRAPCSPRHRWRGVNLWDLRPFVPGLSDSSVDLLAPARIGVVNAR